MPTQFRPRQILDDTISKTELTDSAFFQLLTSVNSAASPYTALSTDEVILVDTTGGAVTINLPALAGVLNGRKITIKDAVGNAETLNIIVDGSGSETIDGSITITLDSDYDVLVLVKTSSEWARV